MLEPAGEGTHRRAGAIGDHRDRVGGEHRRDVAAVVADLGKCLLQRGDLVGRVLQLDQRQRQPVDEHQHVRAAGLAVLDDAELVDRQPVIGVGIVEVDQLHTGCPHRPVAGPVLHRHPVGDQLVDAGVLVDQALGFGPL